MDLLQLVAEIKTKFIMRDASNHSKDAMRMVEGENVIISVCTGSGSDMLLTLQYFYESIIK